MASDDQWDFLNLDRPAVKPPIQTNAVKQFDPAIIRKDAESTHIVIHPQFPALVDAFLVHKRKHGSSFEKALYATAADFTWRDLVSRLISKRPLVFMGGSDHTLLRDGTMPDRSARMREEWDRNGGEMQHRNRYLTLAEYLSYDEILLGSLVGVSGPSHFVNDGNRYNCGKPGREGTFETRGVIVGLVGARFERADRMDSAFCLPPVDSPKMHPELRRIVQDFFGVARDVRTEFDVETYKARMRVTADILLLEANGRAAGMERSAYVYVVGLGLGVWQRIPQQARHYLDVFAVALETLDLPCVSTVEFAWIPARSEQQKRITEIGARKGIKVFFSERNPAEKLGTEELLVLSYAWDGNAFPGNEYWQGSLAGSGDPAAACMSTVGELHNPLVNDFAGRVSVAGRNGCA